MEEKDSRVSVVYIKRREVGQVGYLCGAVAAEGFHTLGYKVVFYDHLTELIHPGDVVFGQVADMRLVWLKAGIPQPDLICYPEPLRPYLRRKLWRAPAFPEPTEYPVWAKSVSPKRVSGGVYYDDHDYGMTMIGIEGDDVWLSDVVDFVSEWRAYVCDGQIVGVGHYKGDASMSPDMSAVQGWIDEWPDRPAGFGIDVGVLHSTHETVLIEVNDGWALGYWGGHEACFAETLAARWAEIVGGQTIDPSVDLSRLRPFEG